MTDDILGAALDKLEGSIDTLHERFAGLLMQAISDFDSSELSYSALDRFRVRVIELSVVIGEPLDAPRLEAIA